jgi:hypothetical protein
LTVVGLLGAHRQIAMLRGCLFVLLAYGGAFVSFALAVYFGLKEVSWTLFLVILALGCVVSWWASKSMFDIGRIGMRRWLATVAQCEFKDAWDGCGIALDGRTRIVHLTARFSGKPVSKSYPLQDVREWGIQVGGVTTVTASQVYGGGVGGAAHNLGQSAAASFANAVSASNAIDSTGLWLRVRDTEYPRWFIKFVSRNAQDAAAMHRWMEVLQQQINERKSP